MIAREPEKGTNRTVAVELLAILNVGVFPVLALTLFVEGPIVRQTHCRPEKRIPPYSW